LRPFADTGVWLARLIRQGFRAATLAARLSALRRRVVAVASTAPA